MSVSSINTMNYFELLELPESVEPDRAALDKAYQRLQTSCHPDQFAGDSDAAKLRALQQTSLINDAYRILKEPVSRAAHLLQIRGVDIDKHVQGELSGTFLMAQMQLRENLESCIEKADEAGLEALAELVQADFNAYWSAFKHCLSEGKLDEAKATFHKLQFAVKLQNEIYEVEAKLFD